VQISLTSLANIYYVMPNFILFVMITRYMLVKIDLIMIKQLIESKID